MRWALEVQGGYLQQTISWFNFLHFTTNFAVLHSAVFIDKLWKSIFQLPYVKCADFWLQYTFQLISAIFSFSEFSEISAETSNVLADFSYFPFSDFKEKNCWFFTFIFQLILATSHFQLIFCWNDTFQWIVRFEGNTLKVLKGDVILWNSLHLVFGNFLSSTIGRLASRKKRDEEPEREREESLSISSL